MDDSGATYTLGPHMNSSLHHNYAAHAGEIGIVAGGPTGPSGSGALIQHAAHMSTVHLPRVRLLPQELSQAALPMGELIILTTVRYSAAQLTQ